MNMFARFDENPAMTLQDIKETKRDGRTDNLKSVYPPQTKFAGGIITTKIFSVMITITLYGFEPNHDYNYIMITLKLYLITDNYNY